ncbi:hypothetical protein M422DRAFT_783532 [Sphaerobolus stellatus SS14]|uniref:Aldehyde dehydrogenase domain-containing protein n=1 Tax=Sphaerobolus stellatus (strain SS14) TaxID=990650 RepID=A0A0C9V463_SPHS4|nr:hypothetical protein M422DRAFT_783532 [Sphaerobolus stellatus SS14]
MHSSADFEIACRRLLWGKMANAGQTCSAPDYVIVLEKDKEQVVNALLQACHAFYGENAKRSNSFGRLRAGVHWKRVHDLLKTTNGKIVYGGDVDDEDKEIFGPILPIITLPNFDVALKYIRDHDEPLAMYVFHNDKRFANHVRENTLSGLFIENDTLIPCSSLVTPLGGVGASGYGSYKGEYSFKTFTHLRSSYKSSTLLDSILGMKARYPPYTDRQFGKAKALFVPTIPYARPGERTRWNPRQWAFVDAISKIWNVHIN